MKYDNIRIGDLIKIIYDGVVVGPTDVITIFSKKEVAENKLLTNGKLYKLVTESDDAQGITYTVQPNLGGVVPTLPTIEYSNLGRTNTTISYDFTIIDGAGAIDFELRLFERDSDVQIDVKTVTVDGTVNFDNLEAGTIYRLETWVKLVATIVYVKTFETRMNYTSFTLSLMSNVAEISGILGYDISAEDVAIKRFNQVIYFNEFVAGNPQTKIGTATPIYKFRPVDKIANNFLIKEDSNRLISVGTTTPTIDDVILSAILPINEHTGSVWEIYNVTNTNIFIFLNNATRKYLSFFEINERIEARIDEGLEGFKLIVFERNI